MRITLGELRDLLNEAASGSLDDKLRLWLQRLMRNSWDETSAGALSDALVAHTRNRSVAQFVRTKILAPAYVAFSAKKEGNTEEFSEMERRARTSLESLLKQRISA